jgi:hypothetical protein
MRMLLIALLALVLLAPPARSEAPSLPATTQYRWPAPPIAIAGQCNRRPRSADNGTFRHRAKMMHIPRWTCRTGDEFVDALIAATSRYEALGGLILFTHGGPHGLYFHAAQGFYDDAVLHRPALRGQYGGMRGAAYMRSLEQAVAAGRIRWQPEAEIVLVCCNTHIMARHLATCMNRPVIGGEGKVEPINATDTTESGYFTARHGWRRYVPLGGDSLRCEALGDTILPRQHLWQRWHGLRTDSGYVRKLSVPPYGQPPEVQLWAGRPDER